MITVYGFYSHFDLKTKYVINFKLNYKNKNVTKRYYYILGHTSRYEARGPSIAVGLEIPSLSYTPVSSCR